MVDSPIPDAISNHVAAIIGAIAEDRALQLWFRNLVALPDNLRVSAVGRLVAEMTAQGEDPGAVESFRALGDSRTCRAVARVLSERYGVDMNRDGG
jgi:hypothetical protein